MTDYSERSIVLAQPSLTYRKNFANRHNTAFNHLYLDKVSRITIYPESGGRFLIPTIPYFDTIYGDNLTVVLQQFNHHATHIYSA